MNTFADNLRSQFEPVEPLDFYRDIFPEGELDSAGAMTKGKYTAIAIEIAPPDSEHTEQIIKRYTVTDELDDINFLLHSSNFCILAPISYIGKNRKSENARIMYALVVELDNIIVDDGLKCLINQWSERVHWIPKPTYIIASGSGVHLYYLFERGIPLFPNVVKQLMKYKRELTEKIWNRHVTTDIGDKIQQESIFQPFRMVGTLTKYGDITEAFRTGERVSIEYMNLFVNDENMLTDIYKSNLTIDNAKIKYPEWYEKRIIKKEPKGHWICKRDLYDWWKRKITAQAVVGHRYYCIMILAIYAVKCDISEYELENDCFELMNLFESRTDNEDNHFTENDVISAMQSFQDKGVVTYPINSISNRSGIVITKNKRNGRKQSLHLKMTRSNIAILSEDKGQSIQGRKIGSKDKQPRKHGCGRPLGSKDTEVRAKGGGRPLGSGTAERTVQEWQKFNPTGTKAECNRETGLDSKTIRKWWV